MKIAITITATIQNAILFFPSNICWKNNAPNVPPIIGPTTGTHA